MWKKCIKSSKIGIFGIFLIFGVKLRQFHSEVCSYLFLNDYWTTNVFLIDPLKYSKIHETSNFDEKCVKNFEKWKVSGFLSFSVLSFLWKTAIISSDKPTGQRTSAMLSVFNILIYDIYRKVDKTALKR